MEESIEERSGERRVAAEDLSPVSKALVAGNDRRAVLVALTDELEEPRCCGLLELHVAKLVDDEHRNGVEASLFVTGNSVELRDVDLIEQRVM